MRNNEKIITTDSQFKSTSVTKGSLNKSGEFQAMQKMGTVAFGRTNVKKVQNNIQLNKR